jgi:hypothetical protein
MRDDTEQCTYEAAGATCGRSGHGDAMLVDESAKKEDDPRVL